MKSDRLDKAAEKLGAVAEKRWATLKPAERKRRVRAIHGLLPRSVAVFVSTRNHIPKLG